MCDTQAVTSITTDSRNTAWSWLVEACSQKTYDRAREIWAHYVMQNYHDHSVLSGILLLADVYQNFRNSFYEQHQLDQLQFITLPFWHRPHHRSEHVRNDREQYAGRDCDHLSPTCPGPLMEGDDPSKPNSWITYLDANNVYGRRCRSRCQEKISDFDLMKTPALGDCDLYYPENYTIYTVTTPWRRSISPSRQTRSSICCNDIKARN